VPRKTQLCPNPSALQRAVYALLEGTSINELAKKAGVAESGVRKFLTTTGATITHDTLKKLANAKGIPLQSLLGSGKAKLVGKIGAGAVVQLFPGDADQGFAEEIDIPPGLDTQGEVEALEIEGDSMRPLKAGWRVFFAKGDFRPPAELIGQLCVVKLKSGVILLKEVSRGYEQGRFNLTSWNADPINDEEVVAATPVLSIVPR
jgi:hypothetical protein